MTARQLLELRCQAIAGQILRDTERVFLTQWTHPVRRFRSLLRLGMLGSLITVQW